MFIPTVLSDITGVGAEKRFTSAQIPSLKGQTWIVTGGHGGIGLSTTRELAKKGARIVIAGRNDTKCREAIKKLQSENGDSLDLDYVKLDLKSLKSAKEAGKAIVAKEKRLAGIILNAGIMATPYELTEDGVEAQFQVNHLAHFVLVHEILGLLELSGKADGKPARVISLSSFAHNFFSFYPFASPKFTSLADVNRSYDPLGYIRYSQAKLANILFVRELNKRATNVRAVAIHPGFVASSLYEAQPLLRPFVGTFINVEEGAYSTLYAATSPELDEKDLWGSYIVPFAKIKETTEYAKSATLATELWNLSEALAIERGV